ncbi:MAG: 4-(cytidine 5'-diphospho)-2-C-methyl-D-erythritol kinase [Candidatus Brocadiia bacterium]
MSEPDRNELLRVRAPAKVNLTLEVLGRRPDGYHEIRTVMQAVSLYDVLTFRRRHDGHLALECDTAAVPRGEDNLVLRAARLLRQETGCALGAEVHLVKRIPTGGGLGGGSSDAAVTLMALAYLWELGLEQAELLALAARLGSDVPFFIRGGTCLCEGRGERLTRLCCPAPLHYVLMVPRVTVSTAEVYAAADVTLTNRPHASNNVRDALDSGDVSQVASCLHNDLQGPALGLKERLEALWRELLDMREPAGVEGMMLSGSGACFFALMRDQRAARRAARAWAQRLGVRCVPVRSLPGWDARVSPLTLGGHTCEHH